MTTNIKNVKGLEVANFPKERTIKKRNNIIHLNTEKLSKSLSMESLKVFNVLYLAFQYNRDNIEENSYTIKIKQTTLKDELSITNNNYNLILKDSLKELLNKTVIIKNFTSKEGYAVSEHATHLIQSFTDYVDADDNKTKCFKIQIDSTLFYEMTKQGQGYTDLDLKYINSLRSSYQIRLYEFLKSYSNMGKSTQQNMEQLNNILQTDFKYVAKIEEILKRSIKVINEKTDIKISYEKDKKTKSITFKILKDKSNNEKQKIAIKIKKDEATNDFSKEANIQAIIAKITNAKK